MDVSETITPREFFSLIQFLRALHVLLLLRVVRIWRSENLIR